MTRTYSELITIPTFEQRFEYLKLDGRVCDITFGSQRYLNQILYTSDEWRQFRTQIILRDEARDLASPGYEIHDKKLIIIHHLNPITIDDILNRDPKVFDYDNVVCTFRRTHEAIHYGDKSQVQYTPIVRMPNDTCPWKH